MSSWRVFSFRAWWRLLSVEVMLLIFRKLDGFKNLERINCPSSGLS